jgi:hypothetical protein
MVIGFDGCHHLEACSTPLKPSPLMSIPAIQRIIKAADSFITRMPDFSFWYTMLDTDVSIIGSVSQTGELAVCVKYTPVLNPVFTWPFMDYNSMRDPDAQSSTPEQACSLAWLRKMGRGVGFSLITSQEPCSHLVNL